MPVLYKTLLKYGCPQQINDDTLTVVTRTVSANKIIVHSGLPQRSHADLHKETP